MKIVCAGFECHVYHTASTPSIFGVVAVSDDLHFTNRFWRRTDDIRSLIDEVNDVDVVINPVEQEVVLAVGTNAISRKTAACRIPSTRFCRNDAAGTVWAKKVNLRVAPEWEIPRLGCDCSVPPNSVLSVWRAGGAAVISTDWVTSPTSKRQINLDPVTRVEVNVLLNRLLKTGHLDFNRIDTWLQQRANIIAAVIRCQ